MNDQSSPRRFDGIFGFSFVIGMGLAAWLIGHAALDYKRKNYYESGPD